MPREYTSSRDKFLNLTELFPRGMGDLKPFDKALLTLTFFFTIIIIVFYILHATVVQLWFKVLVNKLELTYNATKLTFSINITFAVSSLHMCF